MKSLLYFFIFLLLYQTVFTQGTNNLLKPAPDNSPVSYFQEDFEYETFPPAGWNVQFTGNCYWNRFPGASGYGTGNASARFEFSMAFPGVTQSLVLSSMGVSAAGDTLQFDHAYATYMTENDKLIIETSVNGGLTYQALVTLNGGVSGPLVTAPPNIDAFVPTPSQWSTKRFAIPPGKNRIRFRAVSAMGNNLYLDNIKIGTRVTIDAGVLSFDNGSPLMNLPTNPAVSVRNFGTTTQTFNVSISISPGGYTSARTIMLAANDFTRVHFDLWNPSPGTYSVTAFTNLANDMDHSNDTLHAVIQVDSTQAVANLNALFKNGQVFLTWDNLNKTKVKYTLYKSSSPIVYGSQLSSAQNLGFVCDNSALNKRLTDLLGTPVYLRIDSAGAPLAAGKGLFAATSAETGSFYYAVTTTINGMEDTTIVPGSNSLTAPVSESVMQPKPVWQRNYTNVKTFNIYVMFASGVTSSVYPRMTNLGSYAYNFALIKQGSGSPHPICFALHGGGGSFLDYDEVKFYSIGNNNDWMISFDEWIPGTSGTTMYYGYHENYDFYDDFNQVPMTGIICNFTAARISYTIDWAIRNLPVDSTRTYMAGFSMGGMGTILNSIIYSQKIAAAFLYAPRFNLSAVNYMDILWGTYQTNLMTNEGYRRNERMNAGYLVSVKRHNSLPVLYTFFGRADTGTGWTEKLFFMDSLNFNRHGGFHFWSNTDHLETILNSPWVSSLSYFSFFTKYRTNLSYPAFSNCSINDDLGNGDPASGDSIGTINGYLDWTDDINDETGGWAATLYVKDLNTTSGLLSAPDSGTADITLRRLQTFTVPTGATVLWKNIRHGTIVQADSFVYRGDLLTLQGVKLFKDSSRVTVSISPYSVNGETEMPAGFYLSQNYPNPFNPSTVVSYQLSVVSKVTIKIFDLLGREIETLVKEEKPAGTYEITWNAANYPSGVYFYQLKAGDFVQTKKMMLLK